MQRCPTRAAAAREAEEDEVTVARTTSSLPPDPRPKPRALGIFGHLKGAASLTLRAVEFGFYHALLSTVDRVARLPRNTTMLEAAALSREHRAEGPARRARGRARVADRARADRRWDARGAGLRVPPHAWRRAVPALLPLGVAAHHQAPGDEVPLVATTQARRWATAARGKVVGLIVTLKRENPAWASGEFARSCGAWASA